MNKFITLEGPDGAGKTTLARATGKLLSEQGVLYVNRRQISTASPYAATLMEPLASILWGRGDAPDLSDSFWVHTQAAWFTAHAEQVVQPALDESRHVLLDGWYYKLWSKLLIQGYSSAELETLFARIREPDHVVLLRTAPATLWARRANQFRPAELGMHSHYSELGESSFLDYQKLSLDNLVDMAQERSWTIIDVDADEPVDVTAGRVAEIVAAQLDLEARRTPKGGWRQINADTERAVIRQLHRSLSDRDGNGVIGEFEQRFAEFVGGRRALAFSSATSALHAMCVAAELGEGDEIIAPAYTFAATASPFAYEGVRVVFADVEPVLGNLNPAELAKRRTARTRAVIVTHMWGNPCNMTEIAAFCNEFGLLLLEDCSHAHFASWRGHRVGTFGAMAAFSTNQKAITTGEGGILITSDDRFRELAVLHGHYNQRSFAEIDHAQSYYPYALTGMGLKARLTTLGAAIGLDQLAKAEKIEASRRAVLAAYIEALEGNPVVSPVVIDPSTGEHGLYVMGLRYHSDAARVPIEGFLKLLATAGAEADMPGSTRIIADEPLFHRSTRADTWRTVPTVRPTSYPGAETFVGSFFKMPLVGDAEDHRPQPRYPDQAV